MRNGIEVMRENPRVRITKEDHQGEVEYHIQVKGPIDTRCSTYAWVSVARRGNIKEARVIALCFATIVETGVSPLKDGRTGQ